MDPQEGNYEVTVENGEVGEREKLTKLQKMRVLYPYSLLKSTEATGFKNQTLG